LVAPVAPAYAVVPFIAFLGHLMIAHHVVGAAARVARAPFVAASTAALIAEQSTAAYAAYAPPAPYSYGYSAQSSWYPYAPPPLAYSAPAYAGSPAYYPSAPVYYGPASYYAYRNRAYDPRGPTYRAPAYYARTPTYPARSVYYGASRGYYRSQVSYPQSVPRGYGPARSYDAPRANYRGSYAFQSGGRGGAPGYRR
jgi:hypothetical protein